MTIDLEVEYNNRARVPGHPALIAGWAADAAAYRAEAGNRHSVISYGHGPRQTLDLFVPEKARPNAAPVLFIHGGYWQALAPSFFSHMAKGANTHGLTVAVAGYDLCPDVALGEIIEQMILAAKTLFRLSNSRIVACGHSAGGHLAACLCATDWPGINPDYPVDLVTAGLSISGLFELEPLVPTSINKPLDLDIDAARTYSPRLWEPPRGIRFDAWVGGNESPEYLRQSATLTAVWTAAGNAVRYQEVAGADHFTVTAGLADKDNAMTQRLVELCSGTA